MIWQRAPTELVAAVLAASPWAAQSLRAGEASAFNTRDFGIRADGKSDDNAALARCFAAVAEAGGGTVTIPPGITPTDEGGHTMSRLILQFLVTTSAFLSVLTAAGPTPAAEPRKGGEPGEARAFEFPTSENDAAFRFTSFPDLFNWNIKYPQPGWEPAVDWFLVGMKTEGPAFSLNAGDVMDARWWTSKDEVRQRTNEYWGGFKRRFEDKDITLYIAPGDHEYGDDQGLKKMHLAPVFAEQFAEIFEMPRNGPEHKKGLAYSFARENLAVISVDTFEDAGDRMSMTVSGKQLEWFKEQLKKYQDKDFIIVQGHVPVVGPVASKNSSANMLEGGTESEFWKAMVEHGVDVYFCGEHHRITVKQHDGVWQVVHGALWGTQTDLNYLRGSVWPEKLELELFRFDVEYGGERLTKQHPHRGNGGPWSKVSISKKTLAEGPVSLGKLVIEATPQGNRTTLATGVFARGKEKR